MTVYEKLLNIQSELKAPKGQRNSFGNYNYRSCEDILEAVKPLLKKHEAALVVGDSIEVIGTRFYVKATARLIDITDGSDIVNTAYAREDENKKGMDASQLTGATSSYARKYCLNGLFAIDDTKDADTDEYQRQQKKAEPKPQAKPQVNGKEYVHINENGETLVLTKAGYKRPMELSYNELKQMLSHPKYTAAAFEVQMAINDLEARQA